MMVTFGEQLDTVNALLSNMEKPCQREAQIVHDDHPADYFTQQLGLIRAKYPPYRPTPTEAIAASCLEVKP